MWVYWREECKYCLNNPNCEYKQRRAEYIKALDAVDNKGVYGTLRVNCAYFYLNVDEYLKENSGEYNAVQ